MSYRQLWEGGDGSSFLHRLDGRTKLSFLFLYAMMMIIVDNSRTFSYTRNLLIIYRLFTFFCNSYDFILCRLQIVFQGLY